MASEKEMGLFAESEEILHSKHFNIKGNLQEILRKSKTHLRFNNRIKEQ